MLGNMYEMVCESKIMYGIEVRGLNGARKEVGKVHSRFHKKVTGIPNCAANGFEEMELVRKSRRSKCSGQTVKYWSHVMFLQAEKLIKQCYE
jgi:hypothetical protein